MDINNKERKLKINCSIACLMGDMSETLEGYDAVSINTEYYIATRKVNQALIAKKVSINAERNILLEEKLHVIHLSDTVRMDAKMDYSGALVLIDGSAIFDDSVPDMLCGAARIIIGETLYYPQSKASDIASIIAADTKPYPDDFYAMPGNHDLRTLLEKVPDDSSRIWVSGEVTVLDEAAARRLREKDVQIQCRSLFITEELEEICGDNVQTSGRTVVPKGYEILKSVTLTEATPALYGNNIYVKKDLQLEEKDMEVLDEMESIIVRGQATLPVAAARKFRKIGEAASYKIVEGGLYRVNGSRTITHGTLQATLDRKEKLNVEANGVLIFTEDVVAEDMDALSGLKYNGIVIMPSAAQGAISGRTICGNGIMADLDTLKEMTGAQTIPEILKSLENSGDGGTKGSGSAGGGSINTELYLVE